MESDSLDAKLIHLLMEGRPMTIEDAASDLKISEKKVKRVAKALASRGIIEMEPLPDKTYLRLKRTDISFHGTNPSQEKAIKHKKSKGKKKKEENRSTDMMYQ